MNGVLSALTTLLQAVATAFGGTMGIAIATVGIGGTALGCLLFHVPVHWLWKAVMVSVVLLACGAIAQACVSGA